MGDRLLERGAAQGLVARLAPPFDREIVEAGFREMMGDDFGLGRRALRIVAQEFGGAAMQRLPAALEQAVVGRVLDQRVLEAIVRLRRRALDKQKVGVGEPIQRRLQRWARRFRQRRAAAGMRNRVRAPRRSARSRAQGRAGPGARREIAARSAGWLERRPARRAQEAVASPPRRTAARRRSAR